MMYRVGEIQKQVRLEWGLHQWYQGNWRKTLEDICVCNEGRAETSRTFPYRKTIHLLEVILGKKREEINV